MRCSDQVGATLSGRKPIAKRNHEPRRAQEVHESLLTGRPEDECGRIWRRAAVLFHERFQTTPVRTCIGARGLADHAAECAVDRWPIHEYVVTPRRSHFGVGMMQCHVNVILRPSAVEDEIGTRLGSLVEPTESNYLIR